MNDDFEIIKLQADIILLQKQLKKLTLEHNAMAKIWVEKLKPISDAFYHEIEMEMDERGLGYV